AEMLGDLEGRRITVLGAAFKPNSDDTRDSPALDVACRLRAAGALVTVTDPEALGNAERSLGDLVQLVPGTDEALHGAELTVLLTEWDEFKDLDPVRTASLVSAPRMLDGRNVLTPQEWREAGWEIRSLGRAAVPQTKAPRRASSSASEPRCRPVGRRTARDPPADERPTGPRAQWTGPLDQRTRPAGSENAARRLRERGPPPSRSSSSRSRRRVRAPPRRSARRAASAGRPPDRSSPHRALRGTRRSSESSASRDGSIGRTPEASAPGKCPPRRRSEAR